MTGDDAAPCGASAPDALAGSGHGQDGQPRPLRVRTPITLVLLAMVVLVWCSDRLDWQGERTVYTVGCAAGGWHGRRCAGTLIATDRYRFQALPSRGEVLFRIAGSPEPARRLDGCVVHDGRNWICGVADGTGSGALEMHRGKLGSGLFHTTTKLRWWLLRLGWSTATDADD